RHLQPAKALAGMTDWKRAKALARMVDLERAKASARMRGFSLLIAESFDGLDCRGAARREEAGDGAGDDQQDGGVDRDLEIHVRVAEEVGVGHRAGDAFEDGDAGDEAEVAGDRGVQDRLLQDERDERARSGAYRLAYADLARAL